MNTITGFPPITGKNAKILILGSMPSEESLRQNQYYAHPRNSFWYIMQELLQIKPGADYREKTKTLTENGIALWDVLQACIRQGSLDSSIENGSIITNDFATFLDAHKQIRHVFFNGKKAEQEFRKRVLPALENRFEYLNYHSLPSTSPAMATLSKEDKLLKWSKVTEILNN
jgi:double-stranded uracil-DNA glycosylase